MMICKYRKSREEKTDEKQRSDHTSFSIQCIQNVQLNAMLVMLFCNNNKSFCKIAGKYNQTSIISCSYHSFHLVIVSWAALFVEIMKQIVQGNQGIPPQPATSMRITTSSPAMRLNVGLIVADKVGDSLSTAQWRQTSKDCKEGVQGEGFNYFYVCCVKSHAEKTTKLGERVKWSVMWHVDPNVMNSFLSSILGKTKNALGILWMKLHCIAPRPINSLNLKNGNIVFFNCLPLYIPKYFIIRKCMIIIWVQALMQGYF